MNTNNNTNDNMENNQQAKKVKFHCWVIHKKSGKVVDDYVNSSTFCGRCVKAFMNIMDYHEVIYKPYKQDNETYKKCLIALNKMNELWKDKDYRTRVNDEKEYEKFGYCFQRAYRTVKKLNGNAKKKKYKIVYGQILLKNKSGFMFSLDDNYYKGMTKTEGEIYIQKCFFQKLNKLAMKKEITLQEIIDGTYAYYRNFDFCMNVFIRPMLKRFNYLQKDNLCNVLGL